MSSDFRFGLFFQGVSNWLFGCFWHVDCWDFGPHFDVAWRAHVRGDTTVGSEGSSSASLCSVDLNVIDDELVSLQLLGVGTGLQVLQNVQDDLDRLLWPPTLGDSKLDG